MNLAPPQARSENGTMQDDFDTLPWYRRVQWVNTIFLISTPLAAAILVPFYIHHHGLTWQALLLFVGYSSVSILSITAGYHRFLAHRSYDARPIVKFFYLLFGAAAFQGSALQWCTDHRRHHSFVDTDKDPHNIRKGFWWAHAGWLFFREHPRYKEKFVPDLAKDPMVQWQHKHFVLLAVVMGFGFPTLVGWIMGSASAGLIFGGVLRVVATNHTTFLINSLAHTIGTRPYNDSQTARDSIIMAVLAYGEGYHNYHHQFAWDYRNGVRWYQWDPTKWLIRLLALFGFTYGLKAAAPTDILKAKMKTDQLRLERLGIPSERLCAMKKRVEEAQQRWRTLKEDYRRVRHSVQVSSGAQIVYLKAEIRVAKLEFKMSWRQWCAYRRTFRALRAA